MVARDLDEDPEQLSLVSVTLLRYAEARAALKNAKDDKALEAWEGSEMMERAEENTFQLERERRARKSGA